MEFSQILFATLVLCCLLSTLEFAIEVVLMDDVAMISLDVVTMFACEDDGFLSRFSLMMSGGMSDEDVGETGLSSCSSSDITVDETLDLLLLC